MRETKVKKNGPVLITGGCGFIGSNLANRLLSNGERVLLFDNLSREGVEQNYEWLRSSHGESLQCEIGDIRDIVALRKVVRSASAIYHFAAQVAVTSSLEDPRLDFEVNALGTLNLLECVRGLEVPPPLVFTSTNKVYGSLADITLREHAGRYEPANSTLRANGIDESQPLEFYSPYGCSKGAADQYVLDYARIYNIPALVFRMSCIYGPHQFGNEDQGWVAHFLIRASQGRSITLYGDGKQVRDVLYVDDLIDAMLLARDNAHHLAGQAFNMGGGPANTTSLLELMQLISQLEDTPPRLEWSDWRPGDQKYYVSNHTRFSQATGWRPRVAFPQGVALLHAWLEEARAGSSLEALTESVS